MAIGEWDDNRNAAAFQHTTEHEEFDEHSTNLLRLVNAGDHVISQLWYNGLADVYTDTAWLQPGSTYYQGSRLFTFNDNIPWSMIRAAVYVSAVSGTGYYRLTFYDTCGSGDWRYGGNIAGRLPDAAGVAIAGTGWHYLDVNRDLITDFGFSAGTIYMVAESGRIANPGDSMNVRLFVLWLTHRDET